MCAPDVLDPEVKDPAVCLRQKRIGALTRDLQGEGDANPG
jgi:hypothetical protein